MQEQKDFKISADKAVAPLRKSTSIFSTHKILIAFGILGVVALTIPVIIGHYAEKEIRAALAQQSEQLPFFKFQIDKYDKGLFTSKADVNIVVDMPEPYRELSELEQLKIPAKMLIGHGPFSFRTVQGDWQLKPALVTGHLVFSPDEYLNLFLDEPERGDETDAVNILAKVVVANSSIVKVFNVVLTETPLRKGTSSRSILTKTHMIMGIKSPLNMPIDGGSLHQKVAYLLDFGQKGDLSATE